MALRIVRVNCSHLPPKLRGINFMYPTSHCEGCARLGTNCAVKSFCLGKDPLIRMARVENAHVHSNLAHNQTLRGFHYYE
jgi:hypothetical protein